MAWVRTRGDVPVILGHELGGGLPYYVSGKNMDTNEVFVTTKLHDESLWQKEISLTNIHWISSQAFELKSSP